MAYTKTIWTDRQVTNPLRFSFTLISGTAGATGSVYDLIPNEGTISNSGTAINATNLNNIENGIFNLDAQVTTNTNNISTLTTGKVNKSGDTMSGTLTAPTLSTPTLISTGTLNVSGTSTLSAVTCTQLNATGAGGLQENGVQLTSKYHQANGSNPLTGDLTITKLSPSTIYDDTDAIGTRCAITAYQSKLSFRYGANSPTNEMMYLDGVTGLTFKPNLSFTGASTIGQSGIHMKNSDIVGANGIYYNDELQTDGEGLNFPKTGISGSTTQSDYNCLRVDGSGRMRLAGDVVASVEVGTRIDNLGATPKVMLATDTVTCSVGLSDCPNGWLLQWRQDSGTAFLHYEPVYKFQSQGSSTMINCGNNVVGTVLQKVISFSNTVITGSASNDDNTNINRVLSAVYVF